MLNVLGVVEKYSSKSLSSAHEQVDFVEGVLKVLGVLIVLGVLGVLSDPIFF